MLAPLSDYLNSINQLEIFEKCSILFKASRRSRTLAGEGENLNPPVEINQRDRHSIPLVFRELRFESDTEIGQKGVFFKGLELKKDSTLAKKKTRTKGEILLGFLILAILALVAVMVFLQQFRFNPAVTAQSALEAGMEQSSSTQLSTLVPLPENFTEMTPLENFTPETLYEKINGQADLYLGSGFIRLESQRYVHTDDQEMWFEVFKYDMGTTENAVSVYSQQYRDDGHLLEWAEFAYSVANALFFVHGQDYMEMRAASTSDDLVGSMHEVAKKYVETSAVK